MALPVQAIFRGLTGDCNKAMRRTARCVGRTRSPRLQLKSSTMNGR